VDLILFFHILLTKKIHATQLEIPHHLGINVTGSEHQGLQLVEMFNSGNLIWYKDIGKCEQTGVKSKSEEES